MAQVLDMERHAASWEERLTKEKQRTAMAMAKKREYEGKIDAVYRRNAGADVTRQACIFRDKHTCCMHGCECGVVPMLCAHV